MSKKNVDQLELKLENDLEIKLYKNRWMVLGVFTLFAACNAIQWLEYSIIANIIVKYYGVSAVAVDWTSMIAMALYPIFLLPASFLIDKIGIRYCILFGVIGTTIGAWIKIFSVQPHLFWVTFLGQIVVFVFQIFILSLPPKIAAIWFGPNEISTACGIGISGTQLGTALGFILPPLIVKNHDDLEDIGRELSHLFYSIAIFCTVIMFLIFIFFKSQPPLPPSKAQAQIRAEKVKFSSTGFWTSYKKLMTDTHFLLQANSFGINVGVYIAICTLLNQFILEYFKNSEEDAGTIGLLMVIFGCIGIVTFGPILDKTKKYRENNLALYVMTILGVGSFMVALETRNKIFVYASGCFYGFFLSAYYTVGVEFGVELSYPQPESSSSGIMMSIVQIFGVIFTLVLGQLYAKFGTFWALASMIVCMILGGIMAVFVPGKLLRQEALRATPESEIFLAKDVDTNVDTKLA